LPLPFERAASARVRAPISFGLLFTSEGANVAFGISVCPRGPQLFFLPSPGVGPSRSTLQNRCRTVPSTAPRLRRTALPAFDPFFFADTVFKRLSSAHQLDVIWRENRRNGPDSIFLFYDRAVWIPAAFLHVFLPVASF